MKKTLKGVVYNSNPKHFLSDSVSPHGLLAFRSVCALKNSPVFIHSPGCKQKTNRVARVEPPTNLCLCAGQTNAVCYSHEVEGALKGGVYLFGC